MVIGDMASTSEESYEMARTAALETLKTLMLGDDIWVQLYAAEAILENPPPKEQEKKSD